MPQQRAYRTYSTAQMIVAFARQGVAISTIARALVVTETQVKATCDREVTSGGLLTMPPAQAGDLQSASSFELRRLRDELESAQEVIREMRRLDLGAVDLLMSVARLTPSEAALVSAIAARGQATRERLFHTLYSMRTDMESPEPKVVDVFISHARKKLAPLSITIKTLWGRGYEMDVESIARLKTLGRPIQAPSLVPTTDAVA